MKNIVLIGMSGVGKTQKGKYIADKMNLDFVDTDAIIVEREKITIEEIFSKYGEEYFRRIEEQIVFEVSKLEGTLISTGGGVILRVNNIVNLKSTGFIVYFKAKVSTIVNNLNNSAEVRPLLKENLDLYDSVERLYSSREELYSHYSHMILDIEDKLKENVYEDVLNGYNKYIACGK